MATVASIHLDKRKIRRYIYFALGLVIPLIMALDILKLQLGTLGLLLIIFPVGLFAAIFLVLLQNTPRRFGQAAVVIACSLLVILIAAAISLSSCPGCTTYLQTTCRGGPGYVCKDVAMNLSGQISFNFVQDTGREIYNIQFSCSEKQPVAFVDAAGNGTLANSISTHVSGLQCYNANGTAMENLQLGTPFIGSIRMNYTSEPGIPSNTNIWNTVRVLNVTVKAV